LIFWIFFAIIVAAYWFLEKQSNEQVHFKGAVVVTGTSSGIGESTALMLAKRGFHVFASYRKEGDDEKIKSKAHKDWTDRLIPLKMDVSHEESISEATRILKAWLLKNPGVPFIGVVNNAGVSSGGPIEIVPMDLFRSVMETNLYGPLKLSQECIPLLRDNGDGRIINVSSVLGTISLPGSQPYCASKHALESLSDSLRNEVYQWNIKVVIIQPGYVKTEISRNSMNTNNDVFASVDEAKKSLYPKMADKKVRETGFEPEAVAEVIYKALTIKNPKGRYMIGTWEVTFAQFARFFPESLFDVIARRI